MLLSPWPHRKGARTGGEGVWRFPRLFSWERRVQLVRLHTPRRPVSMVSAVGRPWPGAHGDMAGGGRYHAHEAWVVQQARDVKTANTSRLWGEKSPG